MNHQSQPGIDEVVSALINNPRIKSTEIAGKVKIDNFSASHHLQKL